MPGVWPVINGGGCLEVFPVMNGKEYSKTGHRIPNIGHRILKKITSYE